MYAVQVPKHVYLLRGVDNDNNILDFFDGFLRFYPRRLPGYIVFLVFYLNMDLHRKIYPSNDAHPPKPLKIVNRTM